MRRGSLLGLFIAAFLWGSASPTGANQRKNVLILGGYSPGNRSTVMVEQGVQAVLDTVSEFDFEFFFEYVDMDRFAGNPHLDEFEQLLRAKYPDIPLHGIVAVGTGALEFALGAGQSLFPAVPVVACALPERALKRLDNAANATGVGARLDFKRSVTLALSLHPGTRRIMVVGGAGAYDRAFLSAFREALARPPPSVELEYLTEFTLGEVLERVANAPPHTVVFYVMMFQDVGGMTYIPWKVAGRVAERSSAPVYGWTDTQFDTGIVGGYLQMLREHGEAAGRMLLRILRGEAAAIPAQVISPRLLFDARQLRRWGINESTLPEESEVRFRESTPWELYRGYILGAAALVGIQAALIAGLLLNRSRRVRAEAALDERLRFETLIGDLSAGLLEFHGEATDAHLDSLLAKTAEFLGATRGALFELSGDPAWLVARNSWAREGKPHPPPAISAENFPLLMRTLERGEAVYIAPDTPIPQEAARERNYLDAEGIRGLVVFPLIAEASLTGALSFAFLDRVPTISAEALERLRLVAEMLANALERLRAAEALAESEGRYRAIVEDQTELICRFRKDGTLTFVNERYCRAFGKRSDELLGTVFLPLIPAEDQQFVRRQFSSLSPQNPVVIYQHRVILPDGRIAWQRWTDRAIVGPDGEIAEYQAVGIDVTAQRAAEESLRRSDAARRELAGRLILAQEDERRRLARELHDDLTQRLAALAMEATRGERLIGDGPADVRTVLHDLAAKLRETSADVQSLSRQLHPSILRDLGLVKSLAAWCRGIEAKAGMAVQFAAQGVPDRLPLDVSLALYRIVQEATQNASKHARANTVRVDLRGGDEGLEVRIEDDGMGFDPETASSAAGLGLQSMAERARLVGGVFELESSPRRGTLVRVHVPLGKEHE